MSTCACQTTILFGLLLIIFSAEACIKFFRTNSPEGIWNDDSNPKEFADCECGVSPLEDGYYYYNYRPWNVYIHSRYGNGPDDVTTCTGTIITSNLVATSHTCLMYPGKKASVYHTWGAGLNQFVIPTGNVSVVATNPVTLAKEIFLVEDIILSFHYTLNEMAKDSWPKDNLALLELRLSDGVVADFTKHSYLRPACLPTPGEMSYFEAFEKQVYYYSSAEVSPGEWLAQEEPAKGGIYRGRSCGTAPPIFGGADDNTTIRRNITLKDEKTFCIRFGSRSTFLRHEQGLVVPTWDRQDGLANLRGYLLGIRIESRTNASDNRSLHFSDIIALTDYIEYKAQLHKSRWCRQPSLSALNPKIFLAPPLKYLFGPWVWNKTEPYPPRNESLDCDCGRLNHNVTTVSPQVVGGVPATPYAYGWMALLEMEDYYKGEWGAFSCGASVINDRVILTAAHCTSIYNKDFGLIEEPIPELFIMEVNLHNRTNDPRRVKLKIREIITHPSYFADNLGESGDTYDVALVILEEPLSFVHGGRNGIRPVCLPKFANPIPVVGKIGTLIGWGLTDHTDRDSVPDELQMINLPVQDLKFCNDVRHKYGYYRNASEAYLCIGDLNPNISAAPGDSGGPFMFVDPISQIHTQVGLVSHANELFNGPYNNETGKREHLVFFLDVQKALSFIDYFSYRAGARWCSNVGNIE